MAEQGSITVTLGPELVAILRRKMEAEYRKTLAATAHALVMEWGAANPEAQTGEDVGHDSTPSGRPLAESTGPST